MREQPLMLSGVVRPLVLGVTAGWAPEVHAAITPIAAEWEALADRMGSPPFLRPGWFAPWWDAFGRGSLEILAVRHEGELAAVLPLARRFGVLRSLSNWHTPAYAPVAEPSAERALAAQLLARDARQVSLSFVNPDTSFVRICLEHARAANRGQLVHVLERSPLLGLGGTWEAFEKERFSRRHRAVVRRRREHLVDSGPLAVEVSDGRSGLDHALAEAYAVEAASWKGESGTAIASRPETERFYTAVAHWAAARGYLRLSFLRLDDRAIAFDYSLEAGGVHYLLKTAYDPAYRRFGPGAILRHDMVARAFAHELSVYEFLGDDAPWKRDWTDDLDDRARVQLFAPSASGRLDRAAWQHVVPRARRAFAIVRR
jgi:CelD/BcsL family acetyltransferase involved in cellulose biosynthesis